MGIFSSIRDTVVAVAQPIISAANMADESLEVLATQVHNRAVSVKITDTEKVRTRTAETLLELQARLEADEKLRALYENLEEEFK